MSKMGMAGLWLRLCRAAIVLAIATVPTHAAWAQLTEDDLAKIPAGPQPIKFSHRVHATDNQIPCEYCHIYARRSQVSGAPPVEICMGCHKLVGTQLSEVKKIKEYWDKKEPIPWVKIHDVPDFVRYPHWRHVRASNENYPQGITCQTCHGPIEKMDVVQKFYPEFGQMGWCLGCHLKQPGVLERKRTVAAGPGSTTLKSAMSAKGYHRPNLTDCLTCHR